MVENKVQKERTKTVKTYIFQVVYSKEYTIFIVISSFFGYNRLSIIIAKRDNLKICNEISESRKRVRKRDQ